jgi:hypothetical protein
MRATAPSRIRRDETKSERGLKYKGIIGLINSIQNG